MIPLGLLYTRPLQGWLKTRVFFPEGKPASHDQVHAAVPTCLRHVEKNLVLVSGLVLGAPCRRVILVTDASLTGWGSDILSKKGQGPRPGEWMLHPEVVKQIWRVFGQAQVDLFTTQVSTQRNVPSGTL